MILVTKPFLPDLSEYQKYVSEIWQRNIITNNGPLLCKLEDELKRYFNAKNVLFTSNGTISLQIAIKALDLHDAEIITTPFSYVATTSCIVWENCVPVFADIDSETLNIDPKEIEKKIGPKTKAILATHVFGNPCDINSINAIAKKHNLFVIYDAAHCFGTKYCGESVLKYGDISSISFHATKLFHTIEGGALVCNSDTINNKMSLMRNFGHNGFDIYTGVGINGKNSEFHAAMGLCNLNYVEEIIKNRILISNLYDRFLISEKIKKQYVDNTKVEYNYAYYPILLENEEILLRVKHKLEEHNVFSRRYFYPSLNRLEYINKNSMPVSENISSRILCLPIYFGLKNDEVEFISRIIKEIL